MPEQARRGDVSAPPVLDLRERPGGNECVHLRVGQPGQRAGFLPLDEFVLGGRRRCGRNRAAASTDAVHAVSRHHPATVMRTVVLGEAALLDELGHNCDRGGQSGGCHRQRDGALVKGGLARVVGSQVLGGVVRNHVVALATRLQHERLGADVLVHGVVRLLDLLGDAPQRDPRPQLVTDLDYVRIAAAPFGSPRPLRPHDRGHQPLGHPLARGLDRDAELGRDLGSARGTAPRCRCRQR